MKYKSESSMTLYRINQGFSLANEIFMDNSPNQTGYNTEIQTGARMEILDVCTNKLI